MGDTMSVLRIPVGERQLFLDEAGLARIERLSLTMHSPAKKGAVIRPDVSAGETCLQTRSAPMWDPEGRLFKLMVRSSVYASPDGLHWAKTPVNQRKVYYVALRDPADPDPSARYKGFGPRMEKDNQVGVQPAASPDLQAWQELDVPHVPSGDEYNLSYDEAERRFIATVKQGGPHGRSVYLSTSPDFRAWTEPELIFHADDLDQQLGRVNIARRLADASLQRPVFDIPSTYNVDVYNMGVFRYEGLYVGLPTMFHKTGQVPGSWPGFAQWDVTGDERALFQRDGDWSGFHHVQLACSRDLRHWQRLGDRRPFLDLSPLGAGAYDLGCIIGPSYPVARGNELWFYYTGIKQYGGPQPHRGLERDQGAICLAVLRRDGFVSMDAGEEEGALVTKPFVWAGNSLRVNLDAPQGELRAEVLDQQGRVSAVSARLSGDLPQGEIQWKEGSLASAQGHVVSLRFTLRRARFYAYWRE